MKESSFKEFIEIQRGHDLPMKDRAEGNVPVIGSNGIVGSHNSSKGIVPGITIGRSGSIGNVIYLDEPYFPLNTTLYVTDFKENHERFVYYFLKNFDFSSFDSGSVQPSLNRNYIYTAMIKYPSFKEQKKIAEFLENFDKKIEINQKINKILEQTANTLFKSWFIDFDPVRAKAEKKPTGLSKEISDLFPDSFEDSELDKIPKGWNVGKISENFETILGGTPARKNKNYWQGNLGWINSGKLNDFPVNIASEFINEEAVQGSSTKLANRKSTLIGLVTEMKKDLITFLDEDLYINQSIVAIQPNKNIFPEYVYLYLKANSIRLYSEQSGGAQQHINKGTVNNFKILLPDEKCLSKVNYYFESIFTKICSNARENIVLINLRDTLLPKLVSGQMKLSDAKSLTKEAEI